MENGAIVDDGRILEGTAEPDGRGGLVKIVLIREGFGNKRDSHYYTADVLREAAESFVGAQMYANHQSPEVERKLKGLPRPVQELIGRIRETEVTTDEAGRQCIVGIASVSQPWLWNMIEHDPELLGVSINARGSSREGQMDGRRARIVEAIKNVGSVDWVTKAGAGGKVVALMEAQVEEQVAEEEREAELEEAQQLGGTPAESRGGGESLEGKGGKGSPGGRGTAHLEGLGFTKEGNRHMATFGGSAGHHTAQVDHEGNWEIHPVKGGRGEHARGRGHNAMLRAAHELHGRHGDRHELRFDHHHRRHREEESVEWLDDGEHMEEAMTRPHARHRLRDVPPTAIVQHKGRMGQAGACPAGPDAEVAQLRGPYKAVAVGTSKKGHVVKNDMGHALEGPDGDHQMTREDAGATLDRLSAHDPKLVHEMHRRGHHRVREGEEFEEAGHHKPRRLHHHLERLGFHREGPTHVRRTATHTIRYHHPSGKYEIRAHDGSGHHRGRGAREMLQHAERLHRRSRHREEEPVPIETDEQFGEWDIDVPTGTGDKIHLVPGGDDLEEGDDPFAEGDFGDDEFAEEYLLEAGEGEWEGDDWFAEGDAGDDVSAQAEEIAEGMLREAVRTAVAVANEQHEVRLAEALRENDDSWRRKFDQSEQRVIANELIDAANFKEATVRELKAEFHDAYFEAEVDSESGQVSKDGNQIARETVERTIKAKRDEIRSSTGSTTPAPKGPVRESRVSEAGETMTEAPIDTGDGATPKAKSKGNGAPLDEQIDRELEI